MSMINADIQRAQLARIRQEAYQRDIRREQARASAAAQRGMLRATGLDERIAEAKRRAALGLPPSREMNEVNSDSGESGLRKLCKIAATGLLSVGAVLFIQGLTERQEPTGEGTVG